MSLVAAEIVESQCQVVADQLEGCSTVSDLQLRNSFVRPPCDVSRRIRYDTIEEINVDSKAEYTA